VCSSDLMTAIGLALLLGPSAFLLLWLTYRRTCEASLRSLAFAMLGLVLIMIGNAAEYLLSNVLRHWDARVAFLILNEAFLSTVMTGAFLTRFAHESTRTAVTGRMKVTYWAFSIVFFFLVISLPLFVNGPGNVDVGRGYLASTIFGTVCQLYATVVIIRNRKGLPAFYRFLPEFTSVLLVLGVVSVMNDAFHFGALLHGPEFPFSPVFFFLVNVSVVFGCLKELAKTREHSPAVRPLVDFDLSDRESEIVPLIIEGFSNEDIASRLFISPHTVKNHVTSIFRKAGVTNRFELLKRISAGKAS
jgi:DNA-binding CsgD family transcriptional regulator